MAKKNTSHQLSPENYFRQKAKSLPLCKCYVNKDWEQSKMANVIIARRHVTGNITTAYYLTDLMCLGVKDSFYKFNIPEYEFEELIDNMNGDLELMEIPYVLAHNIIYGAVAYAEDCGFAPCKEFSSVTVHLLEEDTEEVELIDIEFGIEEKPAYMNGPYDTKATISQNIATLEKVVGKGNFTIMLRDGNDDLFDDEYNNEDEEYDEEHSEDPFDGMDFEEKKKLYFELSEKKKGEEKTDLLSLISSIFNDLCDFDAIDKMYENLIDDFDEYDILSIEDLIPEKLLGDMNIDDQINFKLREIYYLSEEEPKKGQKMLNKLKSELPDNLPFMLFLELNILFKQNKIKKFSSLRKEYREKYPDYHLFKLLEAFEDDTTDLPKPHVKEFFKERETIHPIELYAFLVYLTYSIDDNNSTEIGAVSMVFEDLSECLPPKESFTLLMSLLLRRMNFVRNYLEQH